MIQGERAEVDRSAAPEVGDDLVGFQEAGRIIGVKANNWYRIIFPLPGKLI